MEFTDLMRETGDLLGLENLKPDENGLCHLLFPDMTVTVEWIAEYEVVLMSAAVCKIPPDHAKDPAIYRAIIEANFQYRRTCGSTAALDPESDYVYIFRYDRVGNWTAEDVVRLAGRLVDGAESVRGLIADAGANVAQPEEAPRFLLGSDFILA